MNRQTTRSAQFNMMASSRMRRVDLTLRTLHRMMLTPMPANYLSFSGLGADAPTAPDANFGAFIS